MSKNYELIYKRLIKTLKSERKMLLEIIPKLTDRSELVERIESEGGSLLLDWILDEYLPELEGKKWNSIAFHKEEFKEWKKKIQK